MVGIINKPYANISPKKEIHPIHDVLGTNLYDEAKTMVQKSIDNSDIVPKEHNLSENLLG